MDIDFVNSMIIQLSVWIVLISEQYQIKVVIILWCHCPLLELLFKWTLDRKTCISTLMTGPGFPIDRSA